jgi:hypothetical protein
MHSKSEETENRGSQPATRARATQSYWSSKTERGSQWALVTVFEFTPRRSTPRHS